MFINPSKPTNLEGFNPYVDNTIIQAKATKSQKSAYVFLLIISTIFVLPAIIWAFIRISIKNRWTREQMEINNASSNIDVNLTKRSETLRKLLDETKGYLKHERETFEKITQMRSGNYKDIIDKDQALNNLTKNIKIALENYPDLKGNQIIIELMSSSQYIESEIAASRRLYNQLVQRFNADILTFPNVCYAEKLKLFTLPLFVASQTQKEDIDMSTLSNF